MNQKVWLVACVLLVLVALSFPANAFGITSAYYPGNALKLQPGETKTVFLGFQNGAGEPQNFTLIANITKGAEIAHLVESADKQYFVPFGTSNNIGVSFIVTAPAEDPIGKQYEVEVTLTTVTPGSGGGVVLGQSIGETIPVTIISPTGEATSGKSTNTQLIVLIVVIAIIIAVIIIFILSAKKKKK